MKRRMWFVSLAIALAGLIWAVAQLVPARTELASLFPDNALLYIEAKEFNALLKDWDASEEKRTWIKGDNYAAFSRSRLFVRLGQAQGEFSTAATIPADQKLLSSIAGAQSALALYDIGSLEFVYVTRMNQAQAEGTPLWQVRQKFDLRTEGAAQFYVRQDTESNRTAAFAVRDGWLIAGTRADLVAGVLDRLQGAKSHSLSDEPWYTDALKQASGSDQDLRMVLNLEKIVPSPYFRSYWVQRNITEMKQYRAAVCDLHRGSEAYREDRVLLRKPGIAGRSADVQPLIALAPADAVFVSAQAASDPEHVLAELRENVLDLNPEQTRTTWYAPPAVAVENPGSATALEKRIDVAPLIVKQSDPYEPLRMLIASAQPAAILEVYETQSKADEMFVGIDRAVVVQAGSPWSEADVEGAIATALRPGLTASQLGLGWTPHSGGYGLYAALDGDIPLSIAVRGNQLFLATSEPLMQSLLTKYKPNVSPQAEALTYAAVFRHSPAEQRTFRKMFVRLDATGHRGEEQVSSDDDTVSGDDQPPAFFSGNIASLSRMFANVSQERIEERDQGTQVSQKVVYEWQHR